jgi:peptidoglycan biosynthesis protein MviN/MurJ (putative lipid II flippase)
MTVRGDSALAVGGLAVGVSMTYFVETILGLWYLNRVTEVELITWEETIKPLIKKVLNVAIMGMGMYFVFKIFDLQLDTTRTVWVALLTVITTIYGGISYLLGSFLFDIKEFNDVWKYFLDLMGDLKKKFFKKK